MVADYFGNTTDEDTQTFTGFDADIRDGVLIPDLQDRQDALDTFGDDLAVDAGVTDHVETSAGFDADIRDRVLIPDLQDHRCFGCFWRRHSSGCRSCIT